jgi:hypothetical protein
VRERKIHREKERERCINMSPLIVSIDILVHKIKQQELEGKQQR